MSKRSFLFVIAVMLLSTAIIPFGMCQSKEVVGQVSFDTTQVFVRLAGPFSTQIPQGELPGFVSETNTTPVSLDANGDGLKDDWRSGQFPIEAFPGQFVYAHLFFNVMDEQVGVYNEVIAQGGLNLPFRWDVSGLEMLKPIQFLPAATITGAESITNFTPVFETNQLVVPLANITLNARTTYYLGVIEFMVNDIDWCGIVRQVRDEVQPVDPVLADKPDRIADMVIRLVPPKTPQLVYEDMTKLHLVYLCLSGPTLTAEGTVYTSLNDVVIPLDTLKNHLGWNFSNPWIQVPLQGLQGRYYFYNAATLFPFPPFNSYVKLPYAAGADEWVPNFFSNNEIESQAHVKFIDGDGLHVSYVLIDKTNSLSVGKDVTVLLSFSIPSGTLPNNPDVFPAPLQFVNEEGEVLN